jgi:hypothetical protein
MDGKSDRETKVLMVAKYLEYFLEEFGQIVVICSFGVEKSVYSNIPPVHGCCADNIGHRRGPKWIEKTSFGDGFVPICAFVVCKRCMRI